MTETINALELRIKQLEDLLKEERANFAMQLAAMTK